MAAGSTHQAVQKSGSTSVLMNHRLLGLDAVLLDDLAEHVHREGAVLLLADHPADGEAREQVQDHVEIQVLAALPGGQLRDVPAPHLVRACGPQPWNPSGFLRWPCTIATVHLVMVVEHPVEAAL